MPPKSATKSETKPAKSAFAQVTSMARINRELAGKIANIFKKTPQNVTFSGVEDNEQSPLVVSVTREQQLKRIFGKLTIERTKLERLLETLTELSKKYRDKTITQYEERKLNTLLYDKIIDNQVEILEEVQEKYNDLLRKTSVPDVQTRKEEDDNRHSVSEGLIELDKTERPNTEVNKGSYSIRELRDFIAAANKAILEARRVKLDGRGRIGTAHWGGGNKKVTKKNRRKNRRYSRRRQ